MAMQQRRLPQVQAQAHFHPSLVKQFDADFYNMARMQPTLVVFYDSDSEHHPRLKRMYENLCRLCCAEMGTLCCGALDFNMYPETVLSYTQMLPTLYLFIAGIPILYNGSFNLGDIRLWVKLQLQTCPMSPMPTPLPRPQNTPRPTPF